MELNVQNNNTIRIPALKGGVFHEDKGKNQTKEITGKQRKQDMK